MSGNDGHACRRYLPGAVPYWHAEISPGQPVLVNGSGSVGAFTIQLAKHIGAYVIATARPARAMAVRRLGADHIVDYTTDTFADALGGPVDAVLNFAATDTSRAAHSYR